MNKVIFFILTAAAFVFSSCSSMPKDEKTQLVNSEKAQSALQLERGNNEYRWNNYESALTLYHKALESASMVDWQEGIIRSLIQISRTLDQMGRIQEAQSYLNASRELLPGTESRELSVLVLNRESEGFLYQKNYDHALTKINEAVSAGKDLETKESGETWRIKAAILKKMGRYQEAMTAIENAIVIDEKGFFLAELASDYYIKGSLLSVMDHFESSVEFMEKALEKDKFIENSAGIAMDLFGLARIYDKNGQNELASLYYKRLYLLYHYANDGTVPESLLENWEFRSDSTEFHSILRE